MSRIDCILIPGGGLNPDGSLPEWTVARLDRALAQADQADWIGLLSGGTVHKPPPLDRDGYPVFESRQAAAYLAERGMDPGRMLTEIASYDTIGNAYFARLLFTGPFSLANLRIITSAFHLPRTEAIFRWIFSLPPWELDYTLSFEGTANAGLSADALQARIEREERSLTKLAPQISAITTLDAFQRWIYSEHAAYTTAPEREQLSEDELRSY